MLFSVFSVRCEKKVLQVHHGPLVPFKRDLLEESKPVDFTGVKGNGPPVSDSGVCHLEPKMRLVDWSISVSEHIGVVCHTTKKNVQLMLTGWLQCETKSVTMFCFVRQNQSNWPSWSFKNSFLRKKKVVHVISVLQHVIAGQNV